MRLIALIALLLGSGCMAAIKTRHQPVRFDSVPPGAQVKVDTGKPAWCYTPCTIDVRRSAEPVNYTLELSTREPYSAELIPTQERRAAYILPALFDGLLIIPGIIDLAGEYAWNWPTGVHVVLPPEGKGAPRPTITRDQ